MPPQEDISELESQESVYEYQHIGNEEETFWGNEVCSFASGVHVLIEGS